MIDKHLWIGLYQIALVMIRTMPPLNSVSGAERKGLVEARGALLQFVRSTEERFNLPFSFQTKEEKRQERVG